MGHTQHQRLDDSRDHFRVRDHGSQQFAPNFNAFQHGNQDFHAAKHAADRQSTAHKHLNNVHIDHSSAAGQDASRHGRHGRAHAADHPPDSPKEKGWGWDGQKQPDGSTLFNVKGGRVDMDGQGGARGHRDTTLHSSDDKPMDAKKDNYSVFPPSLAKKMGLHLGDVVTVRDPKTGKEVNTVYGDKGPENEGNFGEYSQHALKELGFKNVNGGNGLPDDYHLQMIAYPGTGNGTADLARNPAAMAKAIEDFKQRQLQQQPM